LQEKYEEATVALAEMEKRAVMAESMLEATLQYQSGQTKLQPSPRYVFKCLKYLTPKCMEPPIFFGFSFRFILTTNIQYLVSTTNSG